MADIADVEQAIVNNVTSILYPGGSALNSIIGALCRVYRGWPNSATLNADLGAGNVNVTAVADNTGGRLTTRYLADWRTVQSQPGTTAKFDQGTVVIGGNPILGDVVGLLIDRCPYVYRVQSGDTCDMVASNLAQLLRSRYIINVAGANIAVAGAHTVKVNVVCDQSTFSESRRQEKDVRVIFWCPNPLVRDAAVCAVDSALNNLPFLSLQDETMARMVYRNTESYDQAQNALLYRRDLIYSVEYPTISSTQRPSMLFGGSEINGAITYG